MFDHCNQDLKILNRKMESSNSCIFLTTSVLNIWNQRKVRNLVLRLASKGAKLQTSSVRCEVHLSWLYLLWNQSTECDFKLFNASQSRVKYFDYNQTPTSSSLLRLWESLRTPFLNSFRRFFSNESTTNYVAVCLTLSRQVLLSWLGIWPLALSFNFISLDCLFFSFSRLLCAEWRYVERLMFFWAVLS